MNTQLLAMLRAVDLLSVGVRPLTSSDERGGDPGLNADLGVDVRDVVLHGSRADTELTSDLFVGVPVGEEPKHVTFPSGEPLDGVEAGTVHLGVGGEVGRCGDTEADCLGEGRAATFLPRRLEGLCCEHLAGRLESLVVAAPEAEHEEGMLIRRPMWDLSVDATGVRQRVGGSIET